jgi:hypothetical protein
MASTSFATPSATEAAVFAETGWRLVRCIERLEAMFSEFKQGETVDSKWQGRKDVQRVFGIDGHRLDDWVAKGFVRRAKLGEALQAKALFCASDIEDILLRISVGKTPRLATRHEA